jgi:hypothetical protein
MNKYFTKPNIKNALAAITALLNFIILSFATVSASHRSLTDGVEHYFANGFTLAFSECPPVCDGMKNWLAYYSRFHFFFSLAVILGLAAVALIKKKFHFGGYGLAAVIISVVTSLIYMINGIVANVIASDYASLYYEHYTLAPLGFALVALSAIALFFVELYIP